MSIESQIKVKNCLQSYKDYVSNYVLFQQKNLSTCKNFKKNKKRTKQTELLYPYLNL